MKRKQMMIKDDIYIIYIKISPCKNREEKKRNKSNPRTE